jgi:tetratricopeptide (TPR) repeat protein
MSRSGIAKRWQVGVAGAVVGAACWAAPGLQAQAGGDTRVSVSSTAVAAGRSTSSASIDSNVTALLAAGDREFAARRASAALVHYESALALAPERYDVLWRTSRTLIDVGEVDADAKRRRVTFARASTLARQAASLRPDDAEGHFHVSRALGREALSVSARERTRYAIAIREAALRALALDPDHAGAQHVLGRWHAEIMRLNGFMKTVAKTFMGGKVFDEASWAEAVRLLEGACAEEPNRTVHLVALGQVYRDAGDPTAARRALEAALRAPLQDPNDEVYKREAERDLRALR